MARTAPFDAHGERYEAWFERHRFAYQSELGAIRALLPPGPALEVGVGTGRFAAPLGVGAGVEPSAWMRQVARERGVAAVAGVAEALPYADASFEVVLLVTTICFVDDLPATLHEAYRVLRPGGHLVVGFVDRDSPLGRDYETHRAENVFYRDATFFSSAELADRITAAGFVRLRFRQTIFTPLDEVMAVQPSRPGHGAGSFVVVRAQRPRHASPRGT